MTLVSGTGLGWEKGSDSVLYPDTVTVAYERKNYYNMQYCINDSCTSHDGYFVRNTISLDGINVMIYWNDMNTIEISIYQDNTSFFHNSNDEIPSDWNIVFDEDYQLTSITIPAISTVLIDMEGPFTYE